MACKAQAQWGDHFPFKDRVEGPCKQSNVVNHLKCLNCQEDFIGKTTRVCSIRMKDHEYDPKSHLFEHHDKFGNKIDFGNVKILYIGYI